MIAVKNIHLSIQEIKSRNAAKGILFSTITLREAIISVEDEIERFFRSGIDVLTRNDPEHSGVKAVHFDELSKKIDQLYPELLDEFKREFERISEKLPKNSIDSSAIINNALLERLHNEVDEQKYVINSKTSFWKWAFGDIKKTHLDSDDSKFGCFRIVSRPTSLEDSYLKNGRPACLARPPAI